MVQETELNCSTLVDDLLKVQQAASPKEEPIIFVNSYGGFIALEFTLEYPELVSHLILVNTCAYFDENELMQNMRMTNIPEEVLDKFNSE